jgi:hypothetical protein
MRDSYVQEEAPVQSFEQAEVVEEEAAPQEESFPAYDDSSWNQPPVVENEYTTGYSPENNANEYSSQDYSFQPSVEPQVSTGEYQFDQQPSFESSPSFESPQAETFESYATPVETESYAPVQEEPSYNSFETVTEKPQNGFSEAVETAGVQAAAPARTRFSERNVDLPIEVTEDERRLHNDARRFARLLVSEIKLYNEQKVREGREANDLYERLREAIDRSREMYDKRVQPSVAAKFDYFHYELVNSLGDGEESKLGATYPGAAV